MKIDYNTLVKDGKTAVLVSPKYGAGWSTWNSRENGLAEALLFDKDIVELVLAEKSPVEIIAFITEKYELTETDYACFLGVHDLTVEWVTKGTPFRIDEYDGYESVIIFDASDFYIA